jgi:hypothetical protein
MSVCSTKTLTAAWEAARGWHRTGDLNYKRGHKRATASPRRVNFIRKAPKVGHISTGHNSSASNQGSTFVKMFTALDDTGLLFRKAVNACKHFPRAEPINAAAGGQVPGGAYQALLRKAAELRKADPTLSDAVSFAKAFTDPADRDLAARERRENRPQAGW